MSLSFKMTIFLVVSFCCDCHAQLASESKSLGVPFLAFSKSCAWTDIFEQSLDVEVTARFGGVNDLEEKTRYETVFKGRLIQDKTAKTLYAPWALGATESDLRNTEGRSVIDFNDVSDCGVRYLEEGFVREVKFIGSAAIPRFPCERNCWDRASRIDFKRAICDPTMFTLRSDKKENLDALIERLATLRADQLESSAERIHGKPVLVHRIKADTGSKSVAIPVHRIVVSDQGVDRGLVTEFHLGFMNLGDKERYTSESQLEERFGTYSTKVTWKLFVFDDSGNNQEVVLPISVSKKRKWTAAKHESYFEAQLRWSRLSDESKNLFSVEACSDLTDDYLETIESVLSR